MSLGKTNRKIGRQKRKPSHMRYIAACHGRGRCFQRKITNLVRHCGMTRAVAERLMENVYRKRGPREAKAMSGAGDSGS